jgi:hypothetical protein
MISYNSVDEKSLDELKNDLANTNRNITIIRGKISEYSSQLHMERIRKYDLEYRIQHYDEMHNKS